MSAATHWQLSGDYFENCNCRVLCPCLVSTAPPLTARPTEGACDVALVFHIETGHYGSVSISGLNTAVIAHTPGPMADGNWTVGLYIDDRAAEPQAEALGTIFTGAAGGPMAAFAPLIGNSLGARKVPISYEVSGKRRSVVIPDIMQMSVEPLPSAHPDGESWIAAGHPVAPDRLALAVGLPGNTFRDHGMRWDNSGRNGHYASIHWSSR